MRDEKFYQLLENFNGKIADVYKRTVYLDTRIRAYEAILSRPWFLLRFTFSQRKLTERINRLHLALMKKHDEDLSKEMSEKPKGLTMVTANGELRRG